MKKELLKRLEELRQNLNNQCDEDNYTDLVNITINYDNEAQDDLYLYDTIRDIVEFVTYDDLDYLIEQNKDIDRLRCFINDTTSADIYKLDGYGNLDNVSDYDFELVIDELIEKVKDNL